MNNVSKEFLLVMFGGIVGIASMFYTSNEAIKNNEIEGYHCAPLTKHKTLESAITQVKKHQSITGVK